MMMFVAQVATKMMEVSPGEAIGGGGVLGITYLVMKWLDRVIHQRLPERAGGAPKTIAGEPCPMSVETPRQVDDIHRIVTQTDGEGNVMSQFPRMAISREHDKQNDTLSDISRSQERIADTLDRIESRNQAMGR